MPFIMWFQGPPKAEPLNHTPIPHVNSLPSKLIDGKGAGSNLQAVMNLCAKRQFPYGLSQLAVPRVDKLHGTGGTVRYRGGPLSKRHPRNQGAR
jgi:hypothetical protein